MRRKHPQSKLCLCVLCVICECEKCNGQKTSVSVIPPAEQALIKNYEDRDAIQRDELRFKNFLSFRI